MNRYLFGRVFLGLLLLTWLPESGQARGFRKADLVEVATLDSAIHLDVRYATESNFMGMIMYSQARAFLQRPAAEALLRAQKRAQKHRYGLLIFDAYRPWRVTKKFWDATPPSKRKFVANPKKGSKHNRGCAVDLSLYSLETGLEVVMPSPYDDFTEKAAADYTDGTEPQRKARDLLRAIMEKEGFAVNSDEWWHFDYRDWKEYEILDVPFESIR